jgi:large subunit ribosomal protein L24
MQKKMNIIPKLKIRKGDLVQVIAGDSKGKQGKVTEVIIKTNRAIVEGANLVSKHTKPSAANPNGGIVKKEAPIHISNLMVIDAKTGKPSRVGRKINAEGKSVRITKKSGEEIKL